MLRAQVVPGVVVLLATLGTSSGELARAQGPLPVSRPAGTVAVNAPRGIWLTHEEIMALPMSGPAWQALRAQADQPAGTPDVSNQDQMNNVYVLAKALVYVRTGIPSYRAEVVQNCMAAINTELGGRTLALGRELAAYVIAADLVGLDPADDTLFRAWLGRTLTEVLTDSRSLRQTHEERPNNWGTMAGASRAAVAVYLGDAAELARTAQVFKGYLGDRSSYVGFSYGELSWQYNPALPVGVNPRGATKNGESIDGVLPDDMRRGCPFQFPPCATGYPWEGLQGALVQAEILHRQGFDAWNWEDQALKRAVQFLYDLDRRYGGWWADGDDEWAVWLINRQYGTQYPGVSPAQPGKNMGWTDWTHAGAGGPPPPPDTTPPTISGVGSSNITSSGATVQWSTNEASDTQVDYGTTTSYGSATPLQTALVTSHSAGLSGLAPSTLYHYRVRSRDAAGNLATSGDFTFTTPTASTTASVLPTVETDPSHHAGDTADDSAIWLHPTNTSLSVVIGDDKNGGLMVYGLDGTEIQYIDGTNYNNLDLRYNFPLVGQFSDATPHQQVALVAVGDELNRQIDFFKVNPATRRLEPAGSAATANGLIPYGFCMYRSPISGKYSFFVNAQTGVCQQWEIRDIGAGNVGGTLVREFDVGSQTEGCVADDVSAQFYIGEEAVGIWRYGAEPNAGSARTQVDRTGTGGHLTADVEGLSIYYTGTAAGYLMASSQGSNTIEVYRRDGNNTHLGSFRVVASGTIDEVTGSDGVDVTNFPLGAFSSGLFVIHDSSNSGATASNYKYVPWQSVANALGLTIDTSWDPRLVSGTLPPDTIPPARITDLGSGSSTSSLGSRSRTRP